MPLRTPANGASGKKAIERRKHVDTVIVVSNDKLLQIVPRQHHRDGRCLGSLMRAWKQGVVGISEISSRRGWSTLLPMFVPS
jgi:cell division GTPase FtsZ